VLVQGTRPRPEVVRRLYPLDYVGEIELWQDAPRTATVRSRGPVALLRLSRATFPDKRG